MKKNILLISAVLFILSTVMAYAAEYPYIMRSVRALGMGNSYYSLSDDQYGLFYNPAGLARIDSWQVELLNPQLEWGTNASNFFNDSQDVNWDQESEIAQLLRDHMGKTQHFGLSAFPAFFKKNMAVGLFFNVRGNAVAGNPAYPTFDTEVYVDRGITGGYAMSFLEDDALEVGASIKLLSRSSLKEEYTVADLTEDLNDLVEDDLQDGTGVLVDVGLIYNFRKSDSNPRIGFAINNVGTTNMGDAEDLQTTINLSAAISPKLGPVGTHFVFEIHDMTQSIDEDDDWGKRIHAGAELNFFKDILAVRAGVHQGYVSVGAGLDFNFFRIDYAYYTEEVGAYAGQKDDERHTIQASIGF